VSAPPLNAIVFFAGPPPPIRALPVGSPPRFSAYLLTVPFKALERSLADPGQPLMLDERVAAAAAVSAFHLRCALDVPPGERLPALLGRLDVLFAAGGVAAALPAAQRVFGPSLLAAARAEPDDVGRWLDVFVHRHAVRVGNHVWLHTHGMEYFALPDFECTVACELVAAQEIVDSTVERAVLDGAFAPVREGDFTEVAGCADPAARVTVRRARNRPGHTWGFYGALELVMEVNA
jgi:hypothetical protein